MKTQILINYTLQTNTTSTICSYQDRKLANSIPDEKTHLEKNPLS